MTTNRRQFNQKGYSRLAFILLIVAMCFTAFIAIPFGNTQAQAFPAAQIARNNEVQMSTKTTYDGWELTHYTGYGQKAGGGNKAEHAGGIFFGEADAKSLGYTKPVYNNRDTDPPIPQGLQFMPAYYDYSNGNMLNFDLFKNDSQYTINLDFMSSHFGIGASCVDVSDGDTGSKFFTTKSDGSISVKAEGWNINTTNTGTLGTPNNNIRSRVWRNNGYMYTFIKVPDYMAKYLDVSVTATMNSPAINPAAAGWRNDNNKHQYMMPAVELSVGTKTNETDNNSLAFSSMGSVSATTGITGTKGNAKIANPTPTSDSISMDGNTWIKLSFGVLSTKDEVYGSGIADRQEWVQTFAVSNVKLNFKLKAPNIHTSLNLETSNYINGQSVKRVASFEVAIDKKYLDTNSIDSYLDPTQKTPFLVKLVDTTNCASDYDKDKIVEIEFTNDSKIRYFEKDDINSANFTDSWYKSSYSKSWQIDSRNEGNYIIFTYRFTISQNGRYRVRLYDRNSQKLLQESSNSISTDASESSIDNGAPVKPESNNLSGRWFTNETNEFTIQNFKDTIDDFNNRNGAYASGISNLKVYLTRLSDKNGTLNQTQIDGLDTIFNSGANSDGYKIYDFTGSSNIITIKLQDLYADFYKVTKPTNDNDAWGYGTYALVYQVEDKAGNKSEYSINYFNYENGSSYVFSNLQVQKSSDGKWMSVDEFNNENNWVNSNTINIKFNLNYNDFYFEPTFDLINSYDFEFTDIKFSRIDNIYSATIDLSKLSEKLSKNLAFYIDKIYVNGNRLGEPTKFLETELNLQVDTKNPFTQVVNGEEKPIDNILLDVNTGKDIKKGYYTFRDNRNYLDNIVGNDNKFTLPRDYQKGMYFVVNTNSESMDAYYNKYTIVDANGILDIKSQYYIDNLVIYIPLENSNANEITIKITDQANNESTITLPTIQYDGNVYKVGNMKAFHFENLFNDFIEICETSESAGKEVRLDDSDLKRISNREYARGEKLTIKPIPTYPNASNYEYAGIRIKYTLKNAPIEQENTGATEFVFGKIQTDSSSDSTLTGQLISVQKYNIELLIDKYIDINIYHDLDLLTNDNNTPEIKYDATEQTLIIKDMEGNPIKEGIISENYKLVEGRYTWTGLRNYVEGGHNVTVSIDDTINRIKTRNPKTVIVNIVQRDATVEITGEYVFKPNTTTITQQFGEPINIKFNITTGTTDVLEMKFEIESGEGNNVAGTVRKLIFTVVDLSDKTNVINANNYKFNFVYKEANIELKIEIVPRTVHVTLENVPEIIYGSTESEVREALKGIKISPNKKDLTISNGAILLVNILGDIKLLDSTDSLGNAFNTKTPAGTGYYIDVTKLYVEGNQGNFNIIPDGISNKYNVKKRVVTPTFDNNKYSKIEYGSVPNNFLNENIINFDNIVVGDSEAELIALLKYTINNANVLAIKNAGGYYDAKAGYTVQFALNSEKVHNNYEFNFVDFAFEITKKQIKFGIDLTNPDTITGKEYDGVKWAVGYDYSTIFPYDIEEIKGQFLPKDNVFANYDFTNAKNAFLINEEVLNAKKYNIAVNEGFDALVTNTGDRNYVFVPTLNITTFEVTPKTIDAVINSYDKGAETGLIDFTKLFKTFGQELNVTNIDYTLTGAIEADKSNFKVVVTDVLGNYKDDAITFVNSATSPAGNYYIKVMYAPNDANITNNYIINQKNIVFDILKALYTISNTDKTGFEDAVNALFNNVVYNAKPFAYSEVVTFTAQDGVTIKFNMYTKEQCINAGDYKIYIDTATATANDNTSYSGVDFTNVLVEYALKINPYTIKAENIPTDTKYSKVYDSTTKFSQDVELINLPAEFGTVLINCSATLGGKDWGTWTATITRNVYSKNYKLDNSLKTVSDQKISVTQFTGAELYYVGQTKFSGAQATLNAKDFILTNTFNNEGIVEAGLKVNGNPIGTSIDLTAPTTSVVITYVGQNYLPQQITIKLEVVAGEVVIVDITIKEDTSNLEYNGTEFKPTFIVKNGEIDITSDVNVNTGEWFIRDADTYTITATVDQKVGEIQYIGSKTFTIVVKPKQIDVEQAINDSKITVTADKTFDGTLTANPNIKSNFNLGIEGDNVTVVLDTCSDYQNIIGASNVTYSTKLATDNKNYILVNNTGLTVEGTINKRKVSFTVSTSIIYGNQIDITPVDLTSVVDGFECVPTVAGLEKEVGTYSVTISLDSNLYYQIDLINNASNKQITVNVTKRTVDVSPIVPEVSAGTLAEEVKIQARFAGYVESDFALFRDIALNLYKVEAVEGLEVGSYPIISAEYDLQTNAKYIFDNYTLNISGGTLIVTGTKVKVQFTGGANVTRVFGNITDTNAVLIELINKLKLVNLSGTVVFDGSDTKYDTAKTELINQVELGNIIFIFNGIQKPIFNTGITNLTNANADIYNITLKYKDTYDKQNYVFNSYDANNFKLQINPRKVKFKFKFGAFSYNYVNHLYERYFNYGDEMLDDSILNKILQIVDNEYGTVGTVIDGFISSKNSRIDATEKGGLKFVDINLDTDLSSSGRYKVGTYSLDFSKFWFSASNQDTNLGNYEYTYPDNYTTYSIQVKPKLVKFGVYYVDEKGDSTSTFEYDSNIPAFTDKNWKINIYGVEDGDQISFTQTLNREFDNVFEVRKGGYNFLLNITEFTGADSANYTFVKNGNYANTINMFNIIPRKVNVNSIHFATEKAFDNTSNVLNTGFTAKYVNDTVKKDEKGNNIIDVNTLFNIDAKFYKNGSEWKDAYDTLDIILKIALNDSKNYEIINNSFVVNDVSRQQATSSTKQDLTYKTVGKINPAELKVEVNYNNELLKDGISKVYDGTTKLDITYNDIVSSLFTEYSAVANFDTKNVKADTVGNILSAKHTVILNVVFESTLVESFTNENINVFVNGEPLKFTPQGHQFVITKEYTGATITPYELVATKDSYISKVYDGDASGSIYYDASVNPDDVTGKYVFGGIDNDGNVLSSEVYIKPFTFGNDVINLQLALDKLSFGSNVNAGTYYIPVEATITNIDNYNYRFVVEGRYSTKGVLKQYNGNELQNIKAEIKKRQVTISVKEGVETNISKVYDGTTFIQITQSLNPNDCVFNGILTKDKSKVKPDLNVNAEFVSPYASPKVQIVLSGATLISVNNGDEEYKNYEVADEGRVENLYGRITPRPVDIAKDKIIIFNSRYRGADANNYKVEVIDDIVHGGDSDDTVSIYMPIRVNGYEKGILPQDEKFNLKVYIDMGLEDNIIGYEQNIILKAKAGKNNPEIKLVVGNNMSDANAENIAKSYYINNINDIFQGDTLKAGVNSADSNKQAVAIIQKFIITEDLIYFDESHNVFNKTYDGTTDLNERVKAKIGKFDKQGNDLLPFLTEQIDGILILKREGVYPSNQAGTYNIELKLSNTLTMNLLQETKIDWYELQLPESIMRTSTIEKRIINVYVKPTNNRIYDGTYNAVLGKDFLFEMPIASTGKLDGIMPKDEKDIKILCDSRYDRAFAGTRSLIIDNMRFDTSISDTYKNYDIRIAFDGPNGLEQTTSRTYTGLTIAKKSLTVTPNDLILTYGDKLKSDAEIKQYYINNNIPFVLFDGFVGKDKDTIDTTYYDTITFGYQSNMVGSILNANTYIDVKILDSDKTKFSNYELKYNLGKIIVNSLPISISLPNKVLSYNYGDKIADIEKELILSVNGNIITGVERDNIIRFISVQKSKRNDDKEGYNLSAVINKYEGYLNYSFNIVEFNKNKYEIIIKPVNIPCNKEQLEVQSYVFEFTGRDYTDNILNKCVIYADSNDYIRFNKTLCIKNDAGEYVPAGFKLNAVGSYIDKLYIKVTSEKWYPGEKDWKANANYIDTFIPIHEVTIVNKSVSVILPDSLNIVFNYGNQNSLVANYITSLPQVMVNGENIVKIVILDANGNVVTDKNGKFNSEVTAVGTYTVLAYIESANPKTDEIKYIIKMFTEKDAKFIDSIQNTHVKECAERFGYATAKIRVNEISISNVGKDYINIAPIASDDKQANNKLVSDIIASIKFNTNVFTKENISISSCDVSNAGVYNFVINLVGTDSKGFDASNYKLTNKNFTVRAMTTEKYGDGNVSFKTTDNSNLNQNIVNATLFYKNANDKDVSTMLQNHNTLFGKVHSMVYAQLKEDDEANATITSNNVKLDGAVVIEIKVDGNFKNKDLYVVSDNGVCKKIDNVKYTTKKGATYATFATDELGWFVYADAPMTEDTVKSIVKITVISLVLAAVVIVFIIRMVKVSKATKQSK